MWYSGKIIRTVSKYSKIMRYQNCMCSLIVRVRVLATALIFVNHYHHLYSYSCFLTLPAQPQGTVSYSFLLSLPCRRSRRVLYLTRFFHIRCKRMCPVSLAFFFLSSSSYTSVCKTDVSCFSCVLTHPLQTDVSCFSCVLSFFFFFFFFLSTEHISWTIGPILMKLGHNNH